MKDALKKKYKRLVVILSVVIPLVVAALFGVNLKELGFDVEPLYFLPPIYASLNALTSVLLIAAVWAIKNRKVRLHVRLVQSCLGLSALFLTLYVAYHMTSDSTPYGGDGAMRTVYFFILITHIVCSVIMIPFVLITFFRGIMGAYKRHKKIARITFPLWLYVSVTGVIVYLMISPYYSY